MKRNYNQQVVLKDLSEFNVVYLVPIADSHLGSQGIDLDKLNGYVQWIKERDNAFTILNGDIINGATKGSSAELYDDLVTPDDAYNQAREIFMPIKDKVLMVTRGNHEEAIYRNVGADYSARLAYDLGDVPYKPDGGLLGMRLGTDEEVKHTAMCWVYATHGWGGARTIGAKVKKAQDLSDVANAHVYILSHDHTQNVNRGNILDPPRSRINFNKPCYTSVSRKLYINTGAFGNYGGYVQRKGYTPQDLGTPRIRIEVKRTNENGVAHLDLHGSI